jgi:Flp pilus assembly protein TadG
MEKPRVLLSRLWNCRNGNFAIFSAALLPVLFVSAGFAVDYVSLASARHELQNSVDAAVLAVSRKDVSNENRSAVFGQFLTAQLATNTNITLVDQRLEQTVGVNYIQTDARATASVPLAFMDKFIPNKVSVVSSTTFSTRSIEIAIALDNTGSMGSGGISALKEASHVLVDALGGINTSQQSLKVGLVPFVTSVNVKGEGFDKSWIDEDGDSLYNGWTFLTDAQRSTRKSSGNSNADFGNGAYPHHSNLFKWSGTTWKGCVEARPAPYNTSLTAPDPSNPDTLFVPYFAPDEPGNRFSKGGNSGSGFNNSWLDDDASGSHDEIQRSIKKYKTQKPVVSNHNDDDGPLTLGPNRACPTPIVPLTSDISKVRDGINAMQFWNGSGTNIAEGLAWGWRVLSPKAPYTQAAPVNPDAA